MSQLPSGDELDQALRERNLSTAGLPLNANHKPIESAKQALLADAIRDERDERIAEATVRLAWYTKNLSRGTWALVLASVAIVITSILQILFALGRTE